MSIYFLPKHLFYTNTYFSPNKALILKVSAHYEHLLFSKALILPEHLLFSKALILKVSAHLSTNLSTKHLFLREHLLYVALIFKIR